MKYDLVGIDGNAFCVMGYTANALKREGLGNLCAEMRMKAMSGNYDNLLCVCMDYIDKANAKAIENGYVNEEDYE